MNRIEKNISDLGNKRIGPLLAKLAVPSTIGLLVNSLYNIVDTIFVARVPTPLPTKMVFRYLL